MTAPYTVPIDELVGLAEIAHMAGVTRQAVYNWTQRYDNFPQPISRLAMGPIYFWPEVREWIRLWRPR